MSGMSHLRWLMPDIQVVHSEKIPLGEEVARLNDSRDGVILVGKWSSEWPRLLESLKKMGARWHRVVYVDERDAEKSGLRLEDVVEAYKAFLEASTRYLSIVVFDTDKTVSRRVLLRSGLRALFVYTALLDVASEKCASLKTCSLCMASCPYGVMKGKPPRASREKYTECGLCTSSCPTSFLYTPTHPPDAVKRFLNELAARGANRLVVTCPANREKVYEKEDTRSVVPELPCIASLRVQEYLYARLLGLEATFFCPEEAREKCPRARALEEYLSLIGEAEKVMGPSSKRGQTYSDKLPGILAALVSDIDDWIPLTRLGVFRVRVDENICTLCGACAKACPVQALILVRGDKYNLLFNHSSC